MQSLDQNFLTTIARQYDLSAKQQDAFIMLFSTGKSQQEIAEKLHISHNALRTRMTGVYNKFSFTNKKPNKSRRLHDWLLEKSQLAVSQSDRETAINNADITQLVATVRQAIKKDVQKRCGEMRVLDMTQPIDLSDIFTDVNILNEITAIQRYSLSELQAGCNFNIEQFERLGLGNKEKRVRGIESVEKHPKLMIWGKPGAGKTTFLKYLAIKCISGELKPDFIPIFITLKSFAEDNKNSELIEFISDYLANYKIDRNSTGKLLQAGKLLILLDGLDEVSKKDSQQVISQIQAVADRYDNNQFIITCRIAAKEYTFQGFIEVEIADFDPKQIKNFVDNWFRSKKDTKKAEKFHEKLKNNKPIQELATNPLLLTLLCLVFAEKLEFTANRAELYEEGIDILLRKWDASRNIERDKVYERLTLKRKKDLST